MKINHKKILIVAFCLIAGLAAVHLTVNNLFPMIQSMHSGGMY